MLSFEESIAIAEICVYIPIFFLTIVVIFRHGFHRQLGWIYLAIFCIIRLAGAAFKILEAKHPTDKTDVEWASILQSIGLSPLLLASLGILKRVTDEVSNHIRSENNALANLGGRSGVVNIISKRATANSRRSRVIQILQLPAMIALILCIVGGLDSADTSTSTQHTGKTLFKVGIVIFLIVYLALFAMVVVTMKDVGNGPRGEKRLYFAVAAALPFLAVRLLWALLSVFSNSKDFSTFGGKPLIQLFMAVLEEFIVVCIYTLVGLITSNNETSVVSGRF